MKLMIVSEQDLESLIKIRAMTEIGSIEERNAVVVLLDELLPTDDKMVQAFCDFQAAMLDIYDRNNGLYWGIDAN